MKNFDWSEKKHKGQLKRYEARSYRLTNSRSRSGRGDLAELFHPYCTVYAASAELTNYKIAFSIPFVKVL